MQRGYPPRVATARLCIAQAMSVASIFGGRGPGPHASGRWSVPNRLPSGARAPAQCAFRQRCSSARSASASTGLRSTAHTPWRWRFGVVDAVGVAGVQQHRQPRAQRHRALRPAPARCSCGMVWSVISRSSALAGSSQPGQRLQRVALQHHLDAPAVDSSSAMKSPTMASSSTTITRPHSDAPTPPAAATAALGRRGQHRRRRRQQHAEHRAGAGRWSRTTTWPPWSCTMPCTIASPMPEPRPTSLVEVKGSKMRSSSSGVDAAAAVGHAQLDPAAARRPAARHEAQCQRAAALAQPHADRARPLDRVARVDAQVEQHLLELHRVGRAPASSSSPAAAGKSSVTDDGSVARSNCSVWPTSGASARVRRSPRWRRAKASICAIRSRARCAARCAWPSWRCSVGVAQRCRRAPGPAPGSR